VSASRARGRACTVSSTRRWPGMMFCSAQLTAMWDSSLQVVDHVAQSKKKARDSRPSWYLRAQEQAGRRRQVGGARRGERRAQGAHGLHLGRRSRPATHLSSVPTTPPGASSMDVAVQAGVMPVVA
jgi:hypothetical protein